MRNGMWEQRGVESYMGSGERRLWQSKGDDLLHKEMLYGDLQC